MLRRLITRLFSGSRRSSGGRRSRRRSGSSGASIGARLGRAIERFLRSRR